MSKPIPKFYYEQIKKPGSMETAVDNFWNNTLPHYFTQDKFYGIEQEQRPLEGVVKQRADFTIRYIKNGDHKKVVLMEDKRRGYETQASKWSEAVDQLTNYLKLVRTEQNGSNILYAAVTIGTHVRFYYLVPREQVLRDYPSTSTGKAYELDPRYTKQPSHEIPVMKQRPENNRHGYLVHDACWFLLQKAIEPHGIPLVRLFRICSSLPFPIRGIGVSWGHDYRGLSIIDNQNFYPWEDRLIEQYSKSEAYQHASFNPYDIPELPELLSIPPQKDNDYRGNSGVNSNNCFSVLPWEIREAIAIYLSTIDVANLPMSSKAFLPLLTSQTFWKSRFQPGGEREFVFETRVKQQQPKDWINLYQMTNKIQSPPDLKNRKRIWTLITPLVSLLHFQLVEYTDCQYQAIANPDPRWTVAADIQAEAIPNAFFYEGCRLFHTQTTSLPSGLVRIAFSVTGEDIGYLTGIRFISQDCSHICLGYITEGKELYLDITTIKGFVLAMGPRGIQALQVVNGDGKVSRWFGCPRNSPVTERLLGSEAVSVLKVGLDGYKIVRLSIAGQEVSSIAKPISRNSLRETGMWYPTIPPLNLCLNDESFTGENPLTAGYQPLVWIQFGGTNGVHLCSLTAICVTRLGDLCSIEFHYDRTNTASPETQVLGRRTVTDFSDTIRFPIDGSGGELVQYVAVSLERLSSENVYSFYRHGKLNSLKISTNRGRSIHFQPRGSSVDPASLIPLPIAAGSVLTGFFASQHTMEGLISLGVISEVIQ